METISKFQVESNVKNLAKIRNFVRKSSYGLGITEEASDDVILAVDEAATNIIIHGYKEEQGMIDIEISKKANTLIICLHDQAPNFDPTQVHPPDLTLPLEKRPLGKMGVHLMKSYVDKMIYKKTPEGGNQLTLIKIVSKTEPERRKNDHKT